jgi:hypothetical protein
LPNLLERHGLKPNKDAFFVAAATLLAGILAALGVWGFGESPFATVKPRVSKLQVMGQTLNTDAVSAEALAEAELIEATKTGSVFGALLGLALALSTRVGTPRGKAIVQALVLGTVGGGLLGAVTPIVALTVFDAIRQPGAQDLLPSVVLHQVLWAPLGLTAGLAYGLGRGLPRGRLAASALAGLLGGAIGSVVFDVIGSIAFSLARPEQMIAATPTARLVAKLCVAIGIAALLITPMEGKRKSNKEPIP